MTEQTNEPREYSLPELDQAVATGSITQTQRDQIWTQQIERKALKAAESTAQRIVETETHNNALDGELKQYATMVPEIMKDGSPARQRIKGEFDYLVSRGHDPNSLATELAAVRAAMGPIERVRQYKEGRRMGPDYFGDTQGGQRLSPQQARQEDQWSKLPAAQRQHYETLIFKGIYRDKAAALAEVNWKRSGPPGTRGRA